MIIEHWFTTPVIVDYPKFKYINRLKSFCLDCEKKLDSNQLSNVGGFQSPDLYKKDFGGSLGQEFFNMLEYYVDKFSREINAKKRLFVTNAWININTNDNYNVTHNHPNSIVSGVFYVNVPKDNKSQFIIERPNQVEGFYYSTIQAEGSHSSSNKVVFTPKNEMMILFPSWVFHYVTPSYSNEKRISIAFNTFYDNTKFND